MKFSQVSEGLLISHGLESLVHSVYSASALVDTEPKNSHKVNGNMNPCMCLVWCSYATVMSTICGHLPV